MLAGVRAESGMSVRAVWWSWAALCALVVLAVTGMTVRGGLVDPRPWEDDVGKPDAAGSPAQFRPDRGTGPMTVALRQLDACAVLVRAVDGTPGVARGDLEATAPHACSTFAASTWTAVSVGSLSDAGEKWQARPIVAGGVRAYLQTRASTGSYDDETCSAFVPVTFYMGLRFTTGSRIGGDPCAAVTRLVAAAVGHLQDKTLSVRDESRAPLGLSDACTLLAGAAPELTARWPGDDANLTRTSTIDGCTAQVGPEHEIGLVTEYDDLPDRPGIDRLGSSCTATVRPSRPDTPQDPGVEVAGRVQIVLTDTVGDCAAAGRAAERLPAILEAARRPDPAARVVHLFTPDQPDVEPLGVCADAPLAECRIPRPVTLPADPSDLLAATDANAAYTCALAQEPVRRWFGPQMEAAVYGDFCHFVDTSHEVDVMVSATGTYRLGPDAEPAARPDGRSGPIDGHEVHYTESGISGYGTDHEWTAATGTGPAESAGRGVITIDVILNPARGIDRWVDRSPPLNLSLLPRGEQVLTDILRERFTG